METLQQKASYAMGADMAGGFKSREIEIDPDLFIKGFQDVMAGGELALSEEEFRQVMMDYRTQMQEKQQAKRLEMTEKNQQEGEEFLAKNKDAEGVQVTESGLQYLVLKEGEGDAPQASDTVTVHYTGKLLNGEVFDSSVDRGVPATFNLQGVIKGWTEGVQLMKPGASYRFFIPPDLAYGARGAGPKIGPNATLIFDVELLEVK
ncbi:MAG: FKBP-type peptidyl-prolyl cis-trans isomerase [Verrucomicrobia bacterium]|nr:FKBP-type peptidyl-prolyl cis-trans isomerase [Verrucomicrobiota bacterium]